MRWTGPKARNAVIVICDHPLFQHLLDAAKAVCWAMEYIFANVLEDWVGQRGNKIVEVSSCMATGQ